MTISIRLKKLRKALKLTQDNFSKKINVGLSTVAAWEVGSRGVKPIHISAICNAFNVNENWLRTGEGNMFEEKTITESPALAQLTKEYNLTTLQSKALKAFLNLSSEQKDAMLQAMAIMSNAYHYEISDEDYTLIHDI